MVWFVLLCRKGWDKEWAIFQAAETQWSQCHHGWCICLGPLFHMHLPLNEAMALPELKSSEQPDPAHLAGWVLFAEEEWL